MNSTPEQWTAIQSIASDWDLDDWRKLRYEAKEAIRRLKHQEDFTMTPCDGGCGVQDFKRYLSQIQIGDIEYDVCENCFETFELMRNNSQRYEKCK